MKRPFFSWFHLLLGITILLFLKVLLVSCGSETKFSGQTRSKIIPKEMPAEPAPVETPPPSSPDPEPIVTPEAYERLLMWDWPCENKYSKPKNDRFIGPGPHLASLDLQENSNVSIKLSIQGEICEPSRFPRDIIFVVDMSNSMDVNDKYDEVNKTCGRYRAVKEVLNTLPKDGTVRYGIVMFDYAPVKYKSSALFIDEQSLFSDIAPSTDVQKVLCAHSGTTEYNVGLLAAENLLKMGRPEAFKEIYFVSDGEPDPDDAEECPGCDGVKDATRLKTEGVVVGGEQILVTIATVLIGNYQGVLEKHIASVDKNGKKLHATISTSADLAAALAEFARNDVEKGIFKIKNLYMSDWDKKDIRLFMKPDFRFELPIIELTKDDIESGIEFGFDYSDTKEIWYNYEGLLQFE